MNLLYKVQSKETLFWFVILIPFYSRNTITQLFNKYNNTANTTTIFSTFFTAKLLYPNNTTAISLSLNTVEVLGAHWRYHVDVFNNIGFSYDMGFNPSTVY
jgi:hypothetical protein